MEKSPKKSNNLSEWYIDIILKAKLADYSPSKGCIVFRPYGFAIWEHIQKNLDKMIKQAGVSNAYFPLLIPYSLLKKEKEHIKGFSPELAMVTHGGGKKLEEPLVLRPTSETIMYSMFSKWIQSWRDLPLLINQWANIIRWEMRTYPFIRTTEFLWQEGHTVHANHKEAQEEVLRALAMYQKIYQTVLAIPGIIGRKSSTEKFPGAVETYAYESLMPDGKALQSCTSHDLGQNFSKPFDISFQGKNGKNNYAWQTSWGFTTRSIGGLVMVHGDDKGLRLPPKIAPYQIIIIPVFEKKNKNNVLLYAQCLKTELEKQDLRVKIDAREYQTPGWKFNEWELKGVPLRIEIGPQEVKDNSVTMVRRDNNKKAQATRDGCAKDMKDILDSIQGALYSEAEAFLEKNTREVNDYREFKKIMEGQKGFIKAFWCENPECETKIKQETKATTRLLPLDTKVEKGKCVYCEKSAKHRWIFAQAY